MTSASLINAFGLLIHCTGPSLCHSVLPVVNFIFKKAIDSEEASYEVSQHFKTQDYEEVTVYCI